jgi:outer membrane protein with beta-barrel domain
VATGTPAGVGYSVIHHNGDTVNRIIISSFVTAVAIAAASHGAEAQRSRVQTWNPWQIGGAAGIAIPTSDLGEAADMGFNVAVAVGYQQRATPIGFRGEAAYNEFGLPGDPNFEIPAFTGNVIYAFQGISYSPYAIGGVGLYRPNIGPGNDGENHFGFNLGGGIKLPFSRSFETFVEARYHHVSADNFTMGFIPITIGIMW